MKHLMASRDGMLLWCQPATSSLSREEHDLCMRQFDSMPNLVRIQVEAGKLPAWLRSA